MLRHRTKFFLNEESKPAKPVKEPKIKEKKVKKEKETKPKKDIQNRSSRKGISFYGEKINYFFKNWIIVIILIILLVIFILFVKGCTKNNDTNKPKTPEQINNNEPVIVESISVNLNQEVPTINDFVKNYDKVKTGTDSITYDQTNFDTNKYNAVGSYTVKLIVGEKEYTSRILVVDSEPPVFAVKDVVINEGESYTINDFVTSCSDNSGKECILNYEKTEYSKLTAPGTYTIAIVAADLSGNMAEIQRPKITINAKQTPVTPKTKTCEYGSTAYTSEHVLTYSLIKNNCPLDWNYAKSYTYVAVPEQMAKNEVEKLKEEIENKNISMTVRFAYNVVPIANNEGKGLVGYAVYVFANEWDTKENKSIRTLVKYDLNSNGSRKYTVNELGL